MMMDTLKTKKGLNFTVHATGNRQLSPIEVGELSIAKEQVSGWHGNGRRVGHGVGEVRCV